MASRLGPVGPLPNAPLTHELDRTWLHYAFLSREPGLAMVANLSTLGPSPEDSQQERHRMSILLLHERGRGWRSSQFTCAAPDVPWSAFRQPHDHGVQGEFDLEATSGSPAVSLALTRTSRPCTSQCAPFAADQHLRWQSEPGILARGDWRIDDQTHPAVDAIGYHERVRGRWGWPELGGWVFGFANDPSGPPDAAPPYAVVFTLIQPPSPRDAATGSVMLWRDGRPRRHFPRRMLDVAVRDELSRDDVTQVPPLAQALGVPPTYAVPRLLLITAKLGDDHLVLDFRGDSAARIVNPSESGLRPFSVHEVVGPCVVEGRLGGESFGFETEGIVEFAGGAGDR
jgi:hypothetical protein